MRGLYTRAGPGAGARHMPPALDRSGRTGPGQPRTAPEPRQNRARTAPEPRQNRAKTAAKPQRNRGETGRRNRGETARSETALHQDALKILNKL